MSAGVLYGKKKNREGEREREIEGEREKEGVRK